MKYTVEPGRWIYRNGEPFVSIGCAHTSTATGGAAINPTEADALTRRVAVWLNREEDDGESRDDVFAAGFESKHTPGPWSVNGIIYNEDASAPTGRRSTLTGPTVTADVLLVSGVNGQVAEIRRGSNGVGPFGIADARLIAAAPDLLAAAKTAEGYLSGDMVTRMQAMRALSEAIASAEGDA